MMAAAIRRRTAPERGRRWQLTRAEHVVILTGEGTSNTLSETLSHFSHRCLGRYMRILVGTVMTRHGIAAERLAPVQGLIAERMELPPLTRGTLNLQLASPYPVHADAKIEESEYDGLEFLKLQRCRINGIRCCIMRPHKHEESEEASRVLEIMAPHHFRSELGVQDGDTLDVEVEGDDVWWDPLSSDDRIPPCAEPARGGQKAEEKPRA